MIEMIGAGILQLVISFFATLAFAILFHVPQDQYFFSGITGAVGWVCYWALCEFQGWGVVAASLVASLVLTVMSRIFSVRRKTPITIFLICGIFPLVPGAGIYYSAYHFIMGENVLFWEKAEETLKIAVAIALGIVLVFSLPGKLFRILLPKPASSSKTQNL